VPRLAVAYVTQRCNQRCVFCLERDPTPVGFVEPTTDEVVQTLAKLRADGADRVVFMGSETLLRPDAVAIVRAARRLGFEGVVVATNGTPLARRGSAEGLAGFPALLDAATLAMRIADASKASTEDARDAVAGVEAGGWRRASKRA
jgi:MoaA/NifB/PqqE/SkfB family radical SAM enzyme